MGKEKRKGKRPERKRWFQNRLFEYIAYCGLRIVVAMANLLPNSTVPFFGRMLGWTIRIFDRKHVRIALKNLHLSPDVVKTEDVPRVLTQVFTNTGMAIIEMLRMPRFLARNRLGETVDCRGLEYFDQTLAKGNGCIVVVGHLGNYELGGVVTASKGYPLNALARPIQNRYIDRFVTEIRSQTGNKIIPTTRAIGEMMRVLRRNEILVVEIDLDAKYDGILVDFCGRPASTYRSPALFALKFKTPIILSHSYRENGANVMQLCEPIDPADFADRENPVEELTHFIGKKFDERVRARPDQWFWLLDRWRGAEKLIRRRAAEKEQADAAAKAQEPMAAQETAPVEDSPS
ncbi:MAG: lysophospholipid acyltransferase family protein [Planctomycetota bacterium]|nr:lysophospholipid acyltransferase family protein [Planctomycetota bacterium]